MNEYRTILQRLNEPFHTDPSSRRKTWWGATPEERAEFREVVRALSWWKGRGARSFLAEYDTRSLETTDNARIRRAEIESEVRAPLLAELARLSSERDEATQRAVSMERRILNQVSNAHVEERAALTEERAALRARADQAPAPSRLRAAAATAEAARREAAEERRYAEAARAASESDCLVETDPTLREARRKADTQLAREVARADEELSGLRADLELEVENADVDRRHRRLWTDSPTELNAHFVEWGREVASDNPDDLEAVLEHYEDMAIAVLIRRHVELRAICVALGVTPERVRRVMRGDGVMRAPVSNLPSPLEHVRSHMGPPPPGAFATGTPAAGEDPEDDPADEAGAALDREIARRLDSEEHWRPIQQATGASTRRIARVAKERKEARSAATEQP